MTSTPLAAPTRPSSPCSSAVALDHVTKTFGSTTALDDVTLHIPHGEAVAVMGPSGSGKSTLAHCMAGLEVPDRGSASLGDVEISALSEEQRSTYRLSSIGMIFQAGHLLSDLPAVENAALGLMFAGVPRREATKRAERWFPELGLDGLERRRPGELSGGQSQRVAIARALALEPRLVIADEPTAALDRATSAAVMSLLVGLCARSAATLVVVTHDPEVAAACSRRVRIEDGRIVADDRSGA